MKQIATERNRLNETDWNWGKQIKWNRLKLRETDWMKQIKWNQINRYFNVGSTSGENEAYSRKNPKPKETVSRILI